MIDLVVSKRKKPIIWFLEECLTSSLDTTISHYKDVHQVFNYKTLLVSLGTRPIETIHCSSRCIIYPFICQICII